MPREILDGFYWIKENGPDRTGMIETEPDSPTWYKEGETVRIPNCAYLLVGDKTLLFDTLSPASGDEILERLNSVLGDRDLNYLVVSHPDVPHAGNTPRILEAYPNATLVAPKYGNGHHLYRLDEGELVGDGDSIDLGGFVVDFHEATFLDAPVSLWMSERTTNTLFPVDWLGFPHLDSECLSLFEEVDTPMTVDRLIEFHGRVMFWYAYVDVPKVKADIDRLIEIHDPDVIAPAHGLVITEDTDVYMDRMKRVVERIHAEGRIGTLG
ncbi:MBL fold metallo-hydrolase [Halostagnicola sp. A-GB9-2]|uniref:MBL fold metallo-hydrolase n=1 Tax=Halostagnicola sp. A-GB9-2 TaxID=3048066 RepID=UPI0024BFCCCB|nr:MBL fold metallo-hydrolase [Halostagnicola sp. A-GB9-2]MDJ1434283.1 MBL fold metallo-hydrolase [Halostagnicola sp. A-GB9-2]